METLHKMKEEPLRKLFCIFLCTKKSRGQVYPRHPKYFKSTAGNTLATSPEEKSCNVKQRLGISRVLVLAGKRGQI